ncbi:MAG: NAD-dependent epimerase/dehydratase family protein [Gemmatimonadota bacterium]
MKALVTGGTGFVGGHLIQALLARGDAVTALVRSPGKAASLGRRGVTLVAGDLHDPNALRQATRNQDVVYHVAGLIAARSETEFLATNRDGAGAVLEAATIEGARRFLLVSSVAAAGPSSVDRPLTGTEPPRPVTEYGRSKLAGENVVRAGTLPWTIVRPPVVYGPGDRETFRLFRAVTLGAGPVFGRGAQQLSVVYGPDLAEALIAAATSPATVGGTFYAAHPEIVTSRSLLEGIAAADGRRVRILPLPHALGRLALALTETVARVRNRATVLNRDKAHEFFAAAWTVDPTPLTTATGWRAEFDLARGARDTFAWYRAHGWL